MKPDPNPIPVKDIPPNYRADQWKQEPLDRPPTRAIAIKGQQLRQAMRGGNPLDWVDIHERFVDLWQEARMVIWRAKHCKLGVKTYDPVLKKDVQGFIPDDKTVLQAIDTTKGVLDSLIKLRREVGNERTGLPRWALERIELALRDYPDARNALVKELLKEPEN